MGDVTTRQVEKDTWVYVDGEVAGRYTRGRGGYRAVPMDPSRGQLITPHAAAVAFLIERARKES